MIKEADNSRDINLPVYNIKAVARMTGLRPVTLRAWERRYGLPSPSRGQQGYRLYSEYDLRTLRWLKFQIDSGLNISRAVDYLVELRAINRDPALESIPESNAQPISPDHLTAELLRYLLHFDETCAMESMRKAFCLYSIDQVLSGVIQPVLVEVGEARRRGELPAAAEHYVTQFFIQQLMSLLSISPAITRRGAILAAGAPGETHEVSLLSLVVMLRWRGWDVKYFGPDLKLERLEEIVGLLRPRALLFTATCRNAAEALHSQLDDLSARFSQPRPFIILGGRAFHTLPAGDSAAGVIFDDSPAEMVTAIENLISQPA